MGKIALFQIPKVEPTLPWFPTDAEAERYGRERVQQMRWCTEITRQIDDSTRERVAVLGSVLGLTYLNELCVDCALREIAELATNRPDVYAVLDAFHKGKSAAVRKAG
jgi:hypothetical protein